MSDRALPSEGLSSGPEPVLRPSWWGYALFLAGAFVLCSRPLLWATGTHVPIAVFFYLVAAHRWGFRAGLLAATVLVLPTIWWWDNWWYVPLALGGYLFVWFTRRFGLLAAEAIGLYNLLMLPVIGVLMALRFQISGAGLLLFMLQYALGEIAVATIADMLVHNLCLTRRAPFLVSKPSRSIARVLRTTTNFLIIFLLSFVIANQTEQVQGGEMAYRTEVRAAAIAQLGGALRGPAATQIRDGRLIARFGGGMSVRLYFSGDPTGFARRARAALGADCRWPVDLIATGGGFGVWTAACEITRIGTDQAPIMVALSYHGEPPVHAPWTNWRLLVLLAGAGFALAYGISVRGTLIRAIRISEDMVRRFGTPNLPMPERLPITELAAPLREFVARNNVYVAAIEDRDRLTKVAIDLKRSVDLTLMGDLRFDAASGRLHFTEVKMTSKPARRWLQVHASDCALFDVADGSDEATIEFRTAAVAEFDSLMLTLRQSAGPFAWESGVMVKFSQPRRLRDLMVQQARLVDLGSMASAISHEIKQPLFTIAIAAESMQLMLDKGRSEVADKQLADRIARIGEQVERARDIIERISHYGRTDVAAPAKVDVDEAMLIAESFLSAMLKDRGIAVATDIVPGRHMVMMSRIALEQVIVNGIQNAADSIEARREAGWTGEGVISLDVSRTGRRLRCRITDNGVGLPPGLAESAFNAFFTTKPNDKGSGLGLFISRQIIIDAGGKIRLRPGDPDGAILEIELPLHEPAEPV